MEEQITLEDRYWEALEKFDRGVHTGAFLNLQDEWMTGDKYTHGKFRMNLNQYRTYDMLKDEGSSNNELTIDDSLRFALEPKNILVHPKTQEMILISPF